MDETYAAHIREDGTVQTVLEHLKGTASLARSYADSFGYGQYAYICGMLHDIGKYSHEFQKHIRGASLRIDHSAAGAVEISNMLKPLGWLLSYCIAGHHTGLPNGGSAADTGDEPSLHGRIERKSLPDYSTFKKDFEIDSILPTAKLPIRMLGNRGFTFSFLVRMLFSCLIDADFIDTETFMSCGKIERNIRYDMKDLYSCLEMKLASFSYPNTEINKKRNEILKVCVDKAKQLPKGLYTLTVPTGGGKTISSLAFALRHASINNMDRVIYVIPYTSIIEQNAKVFKDLIGYEKVLEHHANFNYDDEDENMTVSKSQHRLATENWDMPVIVTTNVQFFESLFAKKTSKCRKLHNIANSVIIFDEAQMLPTPYLMPCVRSISELVYNYNCTAVLCSATQPALGGLFPKEINVREIVEDTKKLYDFFKRTRITNIGQIDNSELANRINSHNQALCIVNTRRQAQTLYELLEQIGRFHLSTLMCPVHRSNVLFEIRNRLKEGLPCRVISTSLIEAGVDVDFPAVYREISGLDSQIQAAGRCNREGRQPYDQSNVYIFETPNEYKNHVPSSFRRPTEIAKSISQQYFDVASPEAISAYFEQLYRMEGEGLDIKKIVQRMEDGFEFDLSFPFADIAKDFKLIESDTRTVVIPYKDDSVDVNPLINRLRAGERNKELLRRIQPFSVNIYQRDYKTLYDMGLLELLDEEIAILTDMSRYNEFTGLIILAERGIGIFG